MFFFGTHCTARTAHTLPLTPTHTRALSHTTHTHTHPPLLTHTLSHPALTGKPCQVFLAWMVWHGRGYQEKVPPTAELYIDSRWTAPEASALPWFLIVCFLPSSRSYDPPSTQQPLPFMTVRACHKRIRSPSSPSSPNRSSSPSHPPRNSRLQLTAAVLREASPMPETGLVPTYLGHVGSTKDALIIIEACLSGYLNHLGRRPRSSEEWTLSQSGNIFVYETRSSGITTWRDGIPWSEPIKVGNFELRRQLASPASRSSSSSGSNGHSRANGV